MSVSWLEETKDKDRTGDTDYTEVCPHTPLCQGSHTAPWPGRTSYRQDRGGDGPANLYTPSSGDSWRGQHSNQAASHCSPAPGRCNKAGVRPTAPALVLVECMPSAMPFHRWAAGCGDDHITRAHFCAVGQPHCVGNALARQFHTECTPHACAHTHGPAHARRPPHGDR